MATVNRTRVCELCGDTERPVMGSLGVCGDCATAGFGASLPRIRDAHAANRRQFGLPEAPPRSERGVHCPLCARACSIAVGERGFCGLRVAIRARSGGARLRHLAGRPSRGLLHWYRDPLPTNCVADWVCSGHQRSGLHNLAVFYSSCTLNCLGCQNWHFREADPINDPGLTADELACCADADTYCVCFFGGDPASQMPHALATARRLASRGIRVCWETAGTQHPRLMDEAVELALATGGIVKFDLKALDERLHVALTGGRNERTLANFSRAAARAAERPDVPLVVASTLLVPGYVTPAEVGAIARFVASVNPEIPLALLAFAPSFAARDLPFTSRRLAEEALAEARRAGLGRIRIGNSHLLGGPHREVLH